MNGTPFIPSTITVHLGRPDAPAENVTLPFPDYIKNVASSELYPTWPENALRANIYAQVSFALNRVYTEWYRSQGYDFDITNTTAFDQAFVNGRSVFDEVSRIVDELFNDYVRRQGTVEPLFTAYCDGRQTTCDGLRQWDTVTLANQGLTPYEILQRYYGDDIDIVSAPVRANVPSYPGIALRQGDAGNSVQQMQRRLNRISRNYPAIPKIANPNGIFGADTDAAVREFQRIFGLSSDGVIGKETWYRIAYIYTSVKRLSELNSEGVQYSEIATQYPSQLSVGSSGEYVSVLQYYLAVISRFYDSVPSVSQTGVFDAQTENAVKAFQRTFGLDPDGIVGRNTWNDIYRAYRGIVTDQGLLSGGAALYPGFILQLGSSGEYVSLLQEYLNELARVYPSIPSVTVDGRFGQATDTAVRAAQNQLGLTPNGIVGAVTWSAIANEYDTLYFGRQRQQGQFGGETLTQTE
ncbi:MAG: peptidoglycan-binding protein [Clostridia bacterium]|nr:peptidoglycan-binding protein [Clostridia bacterium]